MINCSKFPDYTGIVNTGHNMSVVLTGEATENFYSKFGRISPNAKMFAVNNRTKELVGVSSKFMSTDIGLATSVSVWGEDPYGNEIPSGKEDSVFWQKYAEFKGCKSGDEISLYLLNGLKLYSLAITEPIKYETNGLLAITKIIVSFEYVCSYQNTLLNINQVKENLSKINNLISDLKRPKPSPNFVGANGSIERSDEGYLATLGVTKEATQSQLNSLIERGSDGEAGVSEGNDEVDDAKNNILLGVVVLMLVYCTVKNIK